VPDPFMIIDRDIEVADG